MFILKQVQIYEATKVSVELRKAYRCVKSVYTLPFPKPHLWDFTRCVVVHLYILKLTLNIN